MKSENNNNKILISLVYILLLGCGGSIFGILCLYTTRIVWVRENSMLLSLCVSTIIFILCSIAVWAVCREKETLYKLLTSLLVGILFSLILLFFLLKINFFSWIKDKHALAEYLKKYGAWMPIVYIILQYLQVVILPIPSVVSTAVGVVLFGPFATILYSIIGIVLGRKS